LHGDSSSQYWSLASHLHPHQLPDEGDEGAGAGVGDVESLGGGKGLVEGLVDDSGGAVGVDGGAVEPGAGVVVVLSAGAAGSD